jgi:cell division protein FtsI/penicillin-binding protein 2
MRAAVAESYGTAKGLAFSQVAVAGKTGTAELGVTKEYVNSWSMGFFPYEKPKYAFAVMIEKGHKSNLTGATFAMRQVIEWMINERPEYVGLPAANIPQP